MTNHEDRIPSSAWSAVWEICNEFREELEIVRSQEHFLIKLEVYLSRVLEIGEFYGLREEVIRLFLEILGKDVASYFLSIDWDRVSRDPRFRNVNQFMWLVEDVKSRYFGKVEPKSLPWRISTYQHLRPSGSFYSPLESGRVRSYNEFVKELKGGWRNIESWLLDVLRRI